MKKGNTTRYVVAIALSLFVIFLFMLFGANMLPRLLAESDEDLCLKTLTFMAASRDYSIKAKLGLGYKSQAITAPECHMHYETIPYPKDGEKDTIFFALAEQARTCWKKTGQGSLDAFPSAEGKRVNHCIVCSKIEFDHKIKDEWDTLNGLYDYMSKTKMPLSDQTYIQYLCPESTSSKAQCPLRDDFEAIDPAEPHYMISLFSMGNTFFFWFKVSTDVQAVRMYEVDEMPDSGCHYLYS